VPKSEPVNLGDFTLNFTPATSCAMAG